MNLLSIGSAPTASWSRCSGDGGSRLRPRSGPTPITSIIVVIMFPILSGSDGLRGSCCRGIKEEYDRTADNTESVAWGSSPARPGQ